MPNGFQKDAVAAEQEPLSGPSSRRRDPPVDHDIGTENICPRKGKLCFANAGGRGGGFAGIIFASDAWSFITNVDLAVSGGLSEMVTYSAIWRKESKRDQNLTTPSLTSSRRQFFTNREAMTTVSAKRPAALSRRWRWAGRWSRPTVRSRSRSTLPPIRASRAFRVPRSSVELLCQASS